MIYFSQDNFIQEKITFRNESFFKEDLEKNKGRLTQLIESKSILVIGGAGTIGSSFIRAILPYKPGSLIVVDQNENDLTELTRDLRSSYNEFIPDEYITYPFNFGSEVFEKLIKKHDFDAVACFAAHKHVRSEKDHLAIEAMISNNVFNTQKLLENLKGKKLSHFFSVSTDKAANPVNVMGASKKLMEHVLMQYSDIMNISTARFANVAFSNGSLLYGFNHRIAKRQPLSAPSNVKRYFVSPNESGQLCMLACFLGERGDIFFPKLKEDQMLTFSEIAEKYLQTLGLEPDYCETEDEARNKASKWTPENKNYPVYFFGTATSGEKKYEEFFEENDTIDNDSFSSLGIIKKDSTISYDVETTISQLKATFDSDISKKDIVRLLKEILPGFNHIEKDKNLDQVL